jgi:hypothetical protein
VTTDSETKVVSRLAATAEFANAFNGAAAPFAGVGVPIAPLTAEQMALQGFPGAEATAAARATYQTPSAAVESVANSALREDIARIGADGHALARHGGAIPDEQLVQRALTGYAPDGTVKLNPKTGQPILPPMASAFNSDELLSFADNAVRQNYLERAAALSPGQTVLRLEGVDLGFDLGRGYARIGGSTFSPSLQGPPQLFTGLQKVDAVYKWDSTLNRWATDTIFPVR